MKAMTAILMAMLLFTACSKDSNPVTGGNNGETTQVTEGNDPNFKIVSHNDAGMSKMNRKVQVFGIDIYAASGVADSKLLHAANVMAQYLDNDEDGQVDNQLVLDKMLENKAFMVMWKTENDFPDELPNGREGQDLGNDETNENYIASGKSGRFDASLEEVWHIITHAGYSQVYPEVFGEGIGSQMANAMDIARGGQFTSIPNPYPAGAWYTYDDTTCDYNCMSTEYFYWALTSILGAQETRLDEIGHEWKLNTREKVQSTDLAIYNLLTDPLYKLPTVIPDGTYMR